MSSAGLLLTGSVLFLDGLLFAGRVDGKAVAVFNLFIGALQTAIPFYLIATATSTNAILGDVGIFLFGFTYLYVGIVNLAGFSTDGLGWYSLWVAVVALGLALVNFLRLHSDQTGLLWLQWSVLWGVFWLVLALKVERLTELAGWTAVIMSLTTCTIPGFLLLLDEWTKVPVWSIVAVIAATAVVLVPVARVTMGGATASSSPGGVPETAAA